MTKEIITADEGMKGMVAGEKDGMWTLRRSGMERMKEGMASLEEVIATTVEED